MLIYAAILYVMNVAFPETFGLRSEELPAILINAVFFFVLLVLLFSFTEKRRKRRMEELRARKRGDRPARASGEDGEEGAEGSLRGQPNPNTSRKKARRRSRR